MQNKITSIVSALLFIILLNGCSVDQVYHDRALDNQASWVLLPVVNQSQTPQAGERVEAILASLLRSRGVKNLTHYPKTPQSRVLLMLDDQTRYETALKWALKQKFRYAITGTVEEWRYKAGLDGEPAVGVTLQVIDLQHVDLQHDHLQHDHLQHDHLQHGNLQHSKKMATTTVAKHKTLPVLWSATGARTGWGREGIAAATQKLLNKLLNGMVFVRHN